MIIMFNIGNISYILISAILIVLFLMLSNHFVKEQSQKDKLLKFSALITVIIHYSTLYVDYFSSGSATIKNTMLLPIYPCNICMWLLVIVAFIKNRRGRLYNALSEITFYLGITGGIIGVLFNEIYISNPTLKDWDVLNGLLSHSTMTFGCLYLLVGKYINIRVSNVISVFYGLLILLIDGMTIIGLYRLCNMEPPNSMYLLENPFPEIPWFNTVLIGILALIIVFMITVVYEEVASIKENRWYSKIKDSKEKRV